ncbi:membrane protein [Corynebacterium atypicum]|uniref:Membrane protein n=1 Tax=Corynebacterium atypicum TaxID=191610 RepID=A0ABM5QP52_9CORY|nr:membrane protein [Corynebacterium atypicum]AIG64596.1 membrane protein [Corynebacterium atypicum]
MSDGKKRREHLKVRFYHVLFLAVAVACTLALAWWQWSRFRSGSGTFQNLGYALQWPMFGAFFVYAYRKFLEYENQKIDAENAGDDSDMEVLFEADSHAFDDHSQEIVAEFLPERPQLDVSGFNELNHQRRGHTDLSGLDRAE